MKFELLILGATAFFIYDAYHDGVYMNKLRSWKKYYKMAAYGIMGLCIYIYLKKNPMETRSMLQHENGLIKYMPIDKEASDMLTPFIDDFNSFSPQQRKLYSSGTQEIGNNINNNGVKKTNRSVSETKKKFVASNQGWRCGHCNDQLTAWFEVDHIQRLENGGSNHIDNLIALCRNCHGEKTALERM